MKSVTITVSQKIWKFRFRKTIRRQVAESWSELPSKILERIVELMYTPNDRHVTKLLCLQALLRLHWVNFMLYRSEFKKLYLPTDPEGPRDPDTLVNILTAWLFSGFRIVRVPYARLGKYYGPKDYLDGMTTHEFIIADHHFHRYTTDKHIEDLAGLAAVMYRLPGIGERHDPESRTYCGDIREPFNESTVEKRAKHLAKLPTSRLLVVLSFYRSCRQIWENNFDLVFTQDNEEKSRSKSYGWFEVLKAVSASDFGTIEMKEKVPVGNIFLSMQIDIREAKKLKAKGK